VLAELVHYVVGVDPDREWITLAVVDARSSSVAAEGRFVASGYDGRRRLPDGHGESTERAYRSQSAMDDVVSTAPMVEVTFPSPHRPGLLGCRPVAFGVCPAARREDTGMEFVLWLLAVILVIAGIVSLIRGAILVGVLLIVVGLLVGPGGVSVFT
jgi:hypothetical protein